MVKFKDKRYLKTARDKQTYKGAPINLSAEFSAETFQAGGSSIIYLKCWKGKVLQPWILYLARLSFRIEDVARSFSEKQKTKRVHQY